MAKQIINVATPNSTTGDPLRNAFIKTNDNFTELYDKDVAIDDAVALNTAKVTNATHTGDANGATVLTLASVNSNIGVFGSSTNIPIVTVNAKGLVTAISTQAVSIPSGAINVTGSDITLSGTTGTAITNAVISANAVTNAKLAQVPTKTFKGRTSASTGNVEDLTVAQVRTDLSINNVNNTSDANKPAVSGSVVGIVNNVSLQELGGVDKLINGMRVGRGGGNIISNTASGVSALQSNTTGGGNTASGVNSLSNNATGNSNTANGATALRGNTTGGSNTANGASALESNTSGNSNTANGVNSLLNNTTGNSNTALGDLSGGGITTGSGNTILGANVIGLAAALTNNIILSSGDGVIKARHDGTNWALTGNVTATNGTLLAGTGTTNQLAKFTASGAVGNSILSDTGTLVTLRNNNNNSSFVVGNATNDLYFGNTATLGFLGSYQTNGLNFSNLNMQPFGGNVGINQTNPTERLDVVGNGKFSGTVISKTANFTDSVSAYGIIRVTNTANNGEASASFGNTSDTDDLRWTIGKNIASNGAGMFGFYHNGGEKFKISGAGNGSFTGTVSCGQFTTATEPAYVKGAQFFNTSLNKMRIGGATAYETVPSS